MKGSILLVSGILLLLGAGLWIVLSGRIYTATTGACWAEVVEPFGFGFKTDSYVNLNLNPLCLEKVVITSSVSRCKQECGKYDDCSKKCVRGDKGKTFFILVRKDQGIWDGIKNAVSDPIGVIKSSMEENKAYTLLCDFYSGDIEYPTGDKPECVRLEILEEESACQITSSGRC